MALIPDHREDTIEERTTYARINGAVIEGRPTRLLPPDTRVRWGGVMSGLFVALGVLLLMGALGLAIGVTALGDPRAATSATASGLGIGGGVWAFITLVAAVFLGSLVSTAVTDQPDRMGAVIHGALVWVLLSLFSVWMIASGVSLGVSGLFSAMSGLASSATTAIAAGGGDLVQTLGLKDTNQVMQQLDDPTTASTLAAATGMSNDDASSSPRGSAGSGGPGAGRSGACSGGSPSVLGAVC